MSKGITPAAPEGELTWATNKSVGVVAAGTVLADTGALAAGVYHFAVQLCLAGAAAAGKGLFLEHRNAANAATLKDLAGIAAPGHEDVLIHNYRIAADERLRVVNGVATVAADVLISAIGRQKVE